MLAALVRPKVLERVSILDQDGDMNRRRWQVVEAVEERRQAERSWRIVRLLLDENCAGGRELARRLRSDEHHVQTTIAALGAGVSDAAVAAHALAERRVLLS
jgi:hypothetical protein